MNSRRNKVTGKKHVTDLFHDRSLKPEEVGTKVV